MSVPESTRRLLAPAIFVLLVIASNVLTVLFGVVAIGPLAVTAGTFTAGLVLLARDAVDEAGGARWVLACILAGAAISAIGADPRIAVASAVAFTLSELLDLAVYRKIRTRWGFTAGSVTSNTAGAVLDSAVFLTLAGFPIAGLPGQVIVKVALSTAAVWVVKRALLRQSVDTVSA
jgi:uncharacterized PurR-regulated membrane protein YhhQ (DUF165 family)